MTYRRARQIDCTPWAEAAIGRRLIEGARLPKGYRLMGHASPRNDSWRLTLWRLDEVWTAVAEKATAIRADVPASFQSLVDLAWIDSRERGGCHYCGRPTEMSARLGDRIVGLCGTCYERGREAV